MEWSYVLLIVIPAIAGLFGGIVLKGAKVVQEHVEDQQLIKELLERLADKEDPLTPEEFRDKLEAIRLEYGETKEAWMALIAAIKDYAQKKK